MIDLARKVLPIAEAETMVVRCVEGLIKIRKPF